MFNTFNKILLISKGYPGYYGKAREAIDYFSSLRFVPEIPMNPATFLLDLATGQYLQLKYKTEVEPKEKQNNHKKTEMPEHLQTGIRIGLMFYLFISWTSSSIFGAVSLSIREALLSEREESRYVQARNKLEGYCESSENSRLNVVLKFKFKANRVNFGSTE
ncbi:hypothetical protein V2J09_006589 [Rumex salicifolius]